MSNGGTPLNPTMKNPLDGIPSLDIIVRFYPTANAVNITVPDGLQGFVVLGLLEQAKALYYENFRAMQKEQRILVPTGPVPKIAS